MNQQQDFVNWFRNSAPYIHSHRQRTFVIAFAGEALHDDFFANLIHDIALLHSLGIRLVLVYGIRPQIDEHLLHYQQTSAFHHQLRITDDLALHAAKQAVGSVGVEITALLSMGLANSPMSGAQIKVTSGNFVTAKPIGVLDGIDHCHTGEVRKIDSSGLHQQLDKNNVILIPPMGYSPSGETFNLCSEQVATEIAIALNAEKLIFLTEQQLPIAQMTTLQAKDFLQQKPNLPSALKNPLSAAIHACTQGINRVHLLSRKTDGALLLELFSHNGVGTLISASVYETLRQASLNDIGGILELITPLEEQGKLIKRSREKLEMQINDYFVLEIDGLIVACAALHQLADTACGLISCLAVHPDYQHGQRGNRLLACLQEQAKQQHLSTLYVLSTQTMHWFLERGFIATDITSLPESLKSLYNKQRNSKALRIKVK